MEPRDHPRSRGVYLANGWYRNKTDGSSPLARGLPPPCYPGTPGPGDHPRSRGVYSDNGETAWLPLGSSPLARGLLGHGLLVEGRERIIPARAGFTPPRDSRGTLGRDHPRSRGVYLSDRRSVDKDVGSSPLARGLPGSGKSTILNVRIIPARAGFTCRSRTCIPGRADHPRSRGVYASKGAESGPIAGSSPLARGLPRLEGEAGVGLGIIPARAGFTGATGKPVGEEWDHPRSRGVYTRPEGTTARTVGSSPLARGLLLLDRPDRLSGRIIPARAGFTDEAGDDAIPAAGSSPLARGLRGLPVLLGVPLGIIPARAGFTHHGGGPPAARRDHPRSRGVYPGRSCRRPHRGGSSPLARGLLGLGDSLVSRFGIIPARAGFTS